MVEQAATVDFPALSSARTLWAEGARDAALRAFRAALGERPENVRAHLEAARALGAVYRIAEAEALIARAEALADGDPSMIPAIAASYARIHREARAMAVLRAMDPRTPVAMAELAALYEASGQLAEAQAEIDACIAAAPHVAEPRLARARILRRRGADAEASRALDGLTDARLPDALRAEAWTERCYLAGRAGAPTAAAEAIAQAHAILRARPGTARLIARARANNRLVAGLARDLSPAAVARWRRDAPEHPPLGHLLGFPRSGTTLLEQWLDAHPGLVASPERAHFTANILPQMAQAGGGLSLAGLDRLTEPALAAARARYLAGMSDALGSPIGSRRHLDKNPNHTGLIPALLRLFPGARFVVALRDPRDVIASCVLRSFRLTEFSAMLLDWDTAVELYAAEMGTWLRLREVVPPDQWIETRYEDMVASPRGEVTRVLAALGLAWHREIENWQAGTRGKFVNSPTQTEARQPVYGHAVGRWRAHEAALSPHLERLAPFLRAFGYPPD